ncbi:hypothetical protein [Streptomyces misionensis]|uniref:hypothetical protein n=1 Tax=Streptomyces misionensis TaxID=67331 RepID=UPI00368BEA96
MRLLPLTSLGLIVVAFVLMLVGAFRDHHKLQLTGSLVMALAFALSLAYDIRHGSRILAALDAALVAVNVAGFFGLRRGYAKAAVDE